MTFSKLSPLLEVIRCHAESTPEKTAIISAEGEEITYSRLFDEICRAAAMLKSEGIGQGDRILLSANKETEFIFIYFASHLLGAVNVVVDSKTNKDNIYYIASIVKPTVAIGMNVDGIQSLASEETAYGDTRFSVAECNPEDTADIMFTSGTTGKPKGVKLSHNNIFSSAKNINGFIGNNADDVELLGLPICHSFGLGRLRCNMLAGATVVLHNGFANLKSVFNAFERYGVTGFGMVPAIWAYINKFSDTRIGKYASQIRYIEIGSAAMSLNDKKILLNLFPNTRICMHYGLTEASRALFMEFHEEKEDLSTAGRPASPSVDVKIVDEAGLSLPPGNEGELCVRGNMVTTTYFLPTDNAGAFTDDGYFRTGDWGELSENGKFYLKARKKEIINVGGKKVSPVEIEDAIEQLGYGECMCVAMPDPQGILGEVPKVMIVPTKEPIDLPHLNELLATRLEPYKMPREYVVVKGIPKTASGKKQRTISYV